MSSAFWNVLSYSVIRAYSVSDFEKCTTLFPYFSLLCYLELRSNQAEDRVTWPDLLHRHTSALASFREWSVVSVWLRIRAQLRNPCQPRNSASASTWWVWRAGLPTARSCDRDLLCREQLSPIHSSSQRITIVINYTWYKKMSFEQVSNKRICACWFLKSRNYCSTNLKHFQWLPKHITTIKAWSVSPKQSPKLTFLMRTFYSI